MVAPKTGWIRHESEPGKGGWKMKRLFVGMAAAMTLAIIDPVGAQAPVGQPQWPPTTHPGPDQYRFVAPTPRDAYRQGLINRWELEQLEGPTPQALQGPSPDGNKGFSGR